MTRFHQLSCALALAAASGCGDTETPEVNQLTFDRPVDIAFACHGALRITNGGGADAAQPIETTAMSTTACEARTTPRLDKNAEPPIVPFGQEDLPSSPRWYGLVLQSGPGTVNLVEFSVQIASPSDSSFDGRTLDSGPLTPGKNGISVGKEPVAILTDPAGCHAITANAGSCDLSVLDINSAIAGQGNARVDRLTVKNASGAPILARPAAMVGEPPSANIGFQCPAAPTGLVYVAYPSCHLVAGVDTATGTIVTGIRFDAAGAPTIVDGNVTCPAECGAGGAVAPGVRPVTLDLEVDGRTSTRRLAIGADNSSRITVVELDSNSRPLATPQALFQIPLEDATGSLGVSALALTQEIGIGGGTPGGGLPDALDDEAAGGAFQFVYAVATDGTVRVADVLDVRQECDTQVDPRYTRDIGVVRDLACFPVGAATTPPRRAGARGPGIELPGSAVPLAVEFARVDRLPLSSSNTSSQPDVAETRTPDSPATLIGNFAIVTASSGATFIVNVDDDDYPDLFEPATPLKVSMPLAMAHQLRDLGGQRQLTIQDEDVPFSLDSEGNPKGTDDDKTCIYSGRFNQNADAIGGPRVPTPPARSAQAGTLADEKLTQLPGMRQLLCDRRGLRNPAVTDDVADDHRAIHELAYAAPADARDRAFPDLMALPKTENWTLVWEGALSQNVGTSDVDGPAIREGTMRADGAGLHVLDGSRSLCEAGVEPFDILQLRGCDPSLGATDCPTGYSCFTHPENKISNFGTCILTSEADRLANGCKDFLTTLRRYTVKTTASGELLAVARRRELPTTPLDGCIDDAQCEALADVAARAPSNKHPFQETTTDPHTWACVVDPDRAPIGGTGKRCELRCDPAVPADCVTGTVCKGGAAGTKSGFCMEGVIPSQSCINATQRYDLRAAEAFTVIGSASGFVHPIIADSAGTCVRDPAANRLSIGRLPLLPKDRLAPNTVHACDPAADPISGRLPNGGFEPNPCFTTVGHTEPHPVYTPDPANPANRCDLVSTDLAERQAPAVRFRNRNFTMTLVDPYYPGDAACLLDRGGNLGRIPFVVPGYALSFRVIGGFSPMQALGLPADSRPSFPVKVVRGPAGSLWILDEGDFLSTSSSQASTRGKVIRFDPLAPTGGQALR